MSTQNQIITMLQLQPHPEGGYYSEVYRSTDTFTADSLPHRFGGGQRSASTAIYFLLETGNFSAFHRIKSDEVWHHYEGVALEVVVIDHQGRLTVHRLGKDWDQQEQPMLVVSAGVWFASRVVAQGYALVGCTVSPGFDFADFELANRHQLLRDYPEHRAWIESLTR